MYKLLTTVTLSLSLFLTACSPDPDTAIQAKYISTKEYSSYSCKELIRENNRIAKKLEHSHAHLKKTGIDNLHSHYSILLGHTVTSTRKPEAEDYGLLKGRFEAIQLQAGLKNCDATKLKQPHYEH